MEKELIEGFRDVYFPPNFTLNLPLSLRPPSHMSIPVSPNTFFKKISPKLTNIKCLRPLIILHTENCVRTIKVFFIYIF